MAYELSQGSPGPQVLTPREQDEDRDADDLARLHEWVVEERRNPVFCVLGRGVETRAVGRIEDQPGHLPDEISPEVRTSPEPEKATGPKMWGESSPARSEEKEEGVR